MPAEAQGCRSSHALSLLLCCRSTHALSLLLSCLCLLTIQPFRYLALGVSSFIDGLLCSGLDVPLQSSFTPFVRKIATPLPVHPNLFREVALGVRHYNRVAQSYRISVACARGVGRERVEGERERGGEGGGHTPRENRGCYAPQNNTAPTRGSTAQRICKI